LTSSGFYGGSSSSRSRSTLRTSYSNPPSRSQTPTRSRSSSLEPTHSFSKPLSRATSLQSLTSIGRYSSSYSSSSPFSTSSGLTTLNRFKSASITGLATPSSYSSFSPTFSYRSQWQPTASINRFSSTVAPMRSSLIDIRRPPVSDRYQSNRYTSSAILANQPPSFSPSLRYQHQRSPSPVLSSQQPTTYKYFGNLNYATSYANSQGIGAYTKLLKYSFASGNRDRSSDSQVRAPPSIMSRSNYYEPGYTSRYRSNATATASSYYGRTTTPTSSSSPLNRSSISTRSTDSDSSDLYKTRHRPTGAMSKYWLQPRKLFTGREDD